MIDVDVSQQHRIDSLQIKLDLQVRLQTQLMARTRDALVAPVVDQFHDSSSP